MNRRSLPSLCALSSLLLAALPLAPAKAQNVTLKASHRFSGGKGDVRDDLVQMIARDVAAANVGRAAVYLSGAGHRAAAGIDGLMG